VKGFSTRTSTPADNSSDATEEWSDVGTVTEAASGAAPEASSSDVEA